MIKSVGPAHRDIYCTHSAFAAFMKDGSLALHLLDKPMVISLVLYAPWGEPSRDDVASRLHLEDPKYDTIEDLWSLYSRSIHCGVRYIPCIFLYLNP